MRCDDLALKAVLAIGVQRETFVFYGTGFLTVNYIDDVSFQTVVTAKHVIDKIKSHGSSEVHVRLNTHGGAARIMAAKVEHWHNHPNPQIDVAVCPSVIPLEVFDIMHVPISDKDVLTPELVSRENVGVGDEVFIAGMFVARLGEAKNIPIIRVGTIAAMQSEPIKTTFGYHHAYLVELRSIDGLSGSPVFLNLPPITHESGKVRFRNSKSRPFYPMGMLLGHDQVGSHGDRIEIEQPNLTRPEKKKKLLEVTAPLNTGIGIVLPIEIVKEAINQPKLEELRKIAMKNKYNTFKADAAGEAASPQASDANPTHLEDFRTLLTAASKTPPRGD